MSDELTVGAARQPTRLHRRRHCGGVRGGRARAVRAPTRSRRRRRRDAQLLQLGAVREPEDVRGVHEGDRHQGQEELLRLERDAAREAQGRCSRVRPRLPVELHDEAAHRREAARRAARLVEASERQEERRPEVPQHARRPEEHVLGRQGLGHDRLHVPDGQDQGAADDVERVRRAHEEVRARRRWSTARPRSSGRSRRCSATRTPPRTRRSSTRSRRCCSTLKPYIVALHSSNYDTLIARGKAWMGLGWSGDGMRSWRRRCRRSTSSPRRAARSGSTTTTSPSVRTNPDAAHAWIDFVYQPKNNGVETSYTLLRVAAQAIAPQGHRGREASQRPGRLPAAGDA